MQKIKNLLSPGKPVDDEVLYGEQGHRNSPTADRSSKHHGDNIPRDGHQVAHPDHRGGQIGDSIVSPSAAKQDQSLNAPQSSFSATESSNAPVTRSQEPRTDTSSNLARDDGASAVTGSTLRPEYSTPVSGGSNASIKSNVVGKVPTGSGLTQQPGDLPAVPATDGKFMSDEPLVIDAPTSVSQSTTDQSFPLASGTAAATGLGSARGPHQTATANRIDPGIGSNSTALESQPQPAPVKTTKEGHFGRDAALVGAGATGTGAIGLGAHEVSKRDASAHHDSVEPSLPVREEAGTNPAASFLPEPSTQTSVPSTSEQSPPIESQDDLNPRHMPGAYPETPAMESDKTLGQDTAVAAGGAGAAVIAARKAYEKHAPEPAATPHGKVDLAEANPYSSSLVDPRVDSAAKQAAARSATGGASASAPIASRDARNEDGVIGTQGSLGEKIQESQSKDPHDNHNFALAGATAAGGAKAVATPTAQQDARSQEGSLGPQGSFGEKIQEAETKYDHHGRNIALGGATAAVAGAGAYEVAKHHEQEPMSSTPAELHSTAAQQPGTATSDYAALPTAHAAAAPATTSIPIDHEEREFPLSATHDHSPTGKATNFSYPTGAKDVASNPAYNKPTEHREFPKDAAETGAAGAGGLGAYEALKHREDHNHSMTAPTRENEDPLASSAHPRALAAYNDQRAVPTHGTHLTGREPESHYSRDATLVGGGAGAAELANRKPLDSKLEKERGKTAERKHDDFDKHEKAVRKSEEKHRKSEEKHRKSDDKEHKHGLLHKILHRHKSKEGLDEETEPRSPSDKNRSSYEKSSPDRASYDQSGLAGPSYETQGDESPVVGGDGGTPEHGRHEGRNRLHKDPPPGYQGK